ncbi:hypothetical protein [Haloparvum sp. AD34]
MPTKDQVRTRIGEGGVIAVSRGVGADRIIPVARAVHAAGVTTIEITASDPNVADAVEAARS